MQRTIVISFCFACWTMRESTSFLAPRATASARFPTPNDLQQSSFSDSPVTTPPRPYHKHDASPRARRPRLASMKATGSHKFFFASLTSVATAASVLFAGAFLAAPSGALARSQAAPLQEPVVQALVQLPDEQPDWIGLLRDQTQAPGANMFITASQEGGDKPVLGATVAMEKISFPVMVQLFPANVVGGAKWPGDFEKETTYDVQVTVCGGGEARGIVCKSPPLAGSGESIFVPQLEDMPEIAEAGGMRVPATVVLSAE